MTSRFLHAFADWLDRTWAPVLERTNPILVKEVRQSLRGRYFMVVFWLTLSAATVSGAIILVAQGHDPSAGSGITFFRWMFGCLSVAVHVFVPFSAFLSLGSEWDENTHDLLVLTNLRPGQIVIGKLLSAGVQLLLFYAAFGPFLVFSFLLQGVDLQVAAWALATTLLSSLALSSIAIALSSITSLKFVRIFLLAFLTAGLTMSAAWLIVPWSIFLGEPSIAHEPYFLETMLGMYSGILAVIAFAIAFASARMAHPEENRSTALRILGSVVVAVGIGWMIYGYSVAGFHEFLLAAVGTGSGLLLFLGLFFATEPEMLGRRVRLQVPRPPFLGMLLAPWYPGGGRGYLYLLLHLAAVLGAAILTPLLISGGSTVTGSKAWDVGCSAIVTYVVIWVGIPSLVLSPLTRHLHWRVAARFAIPVLAFAGVFFPMLAGFLLRADSIAEGQHPGNPVWIMFEIYGAENARPALGLFAIAVLVVLANGWRLLKGLMEMEQGARYRREAEARNAVRGRAAAGGGDAVSES